MISLVWSSNNLVSCVNVLYMNIWLIWLVCIMHSTLYNPAFQVHWDSGHDSQPSSHSCGDHGTGCPGNEREFRRRKHDPGTTYSVLPGPILHEPHQHSHAYSSTLFVPYKVPTGFSSLPSLPCAYWVPCLFCTGLLFAPNMDPNSGSQHGHVGSIDPACDMMAVARDAYENARFLCDQYYMMSPECEFVSECRKSFSCVPLCFTLIPEAQRLFISFYSIWEGRNNHNDLCALSSVPHAVWIVQGQSSRHSLPFMLPWLPCLLCLGFVSRMLYVLSLSSMKTKMNYLPSKYSWSKEEKISPLR